MVPRLQDFAVYASTSFGNKPSSRLRHDDYHKVRVILRDKEGSALARVYANGLIVTAENAGAQPLIANRTAIGGWEEFDLIQDN